jgi:C-terminal processing protease CtpA/Prc
VNQGTRKEQRIKMKVQQSKGMRLGAMVAVAALLVWAAAAVAGFAQDGKTPATKAQPAARWEQIQKVLSRIEQRLSAIEERLGAIEKEHGPSAFAWVPRSSESEGLKLPELQEKLKQMGPHADILKEFYRATPGSKYGGIGAYMSQEDEGPVTITEVMDGKPAAKAGLKSGDVIVSVDGVNVEGKSASEVTDLIKGEAGTDVVLTVKRDGGEKDITVTRETIGDKTMELFVTPKKGELGMEMPEAGEDFVGIGIYLGENDEGQPIVQGVMEDTPAEEAGLKTGDVILKIDGKEVKTTDELSKLIGGGKEGEKVTLTIERDGERKDVTVTRSRIKRSALYEGLGLPSLGLYEKALKGQQGGLEAYEQALKSLEGTEAFKEALKGQKGAAEAYKKALEVLKEKDLKLKEIPEGWAIYENEEDEGAEEGVDRDEGGVVKKEVKIFTTEDGEKTRSLKVEVGPDGKAQVFELGKDGEWVERDTDDGLGLRILRGDDEGGKCIILRGLKTEGEEDDEGDADVIRVLEGDNGCCKLKLTGECEGECRILGRSWLDRPDPSETANPMSAMRRSSAEYECPCLTGGARPCGESCAALKGMAFADEAGPCCRTCGDKSGMQCYTTLGDEGHVVVLCRPKGSLSVHEVKDEGCRN